MSTVPGSSQGRQISWLKTLVGISICRTLICYKDFHKCSDCIPLPILQTWQGVTTFSFHTIPLSAVSSATVKLPPIVFSKQLQLVIFDLTCAILKEYLLHILKLIFNVDKAFLDDKFSQKFWFIDTSAMQIFLLLDMDWSLSLEMVTCGLCIRKFTSWNAWAV